MSDTSGQDLAEAFDEDVIGQQDIPPEEPLGLPELLGRDVEVAGDYAPDTVAERSVREEPGGMVEDDGTIDLVEADGAPTDLAAELAEPDPHTLLPSDEALPDTDELPAEAAAIHVVDEG